MRPLLVAGVVLLIGLGFSAGGIPMAHATQSILFATYADDAGSLENVTLMTKSLREFGGSLRFTRVWVYMPATLLEEAPAAISDLDALTVEVRPYDAPRDALWFFFAAKVFAAGEAEGAAEGHADVLAWLDPDTIVLQEPDEFLLPGDKALGYRPVMHKNVGLLWNEPLDDFWARILKQMAVDPERLFPMVTPADGDTIRPYFNAGCLVVRPERGVLRGWVRAFQKLYQDPQLAQMCREDVKKRIFIHQTALTGAILNTLRREELLELSDRINYPIFFEQMFGARRTFNDLNDVVTFRHESYFRDPAPDWESKLKGPAEKIAWMRAHLTPKADTH